MCIVQGGELMYKYDQHLIDPESGLLPENNMINEICESNALATPQGEGKEANLSMKMNDRRLRKQQRTAMRMSNHYSWRGDSRHNSSHLCHFISSYFVTKWGSYQIYLWISIYPFHYSIVQRLKPDQI